MNSKEPDFDWISRMRIIHNESGLKTPTFAKLFKMSKMQMYRVLAGEVKKYSNRVPETVCIKLGYSLEWFCYGLGPKKKEIKGTRLYDIKKLSLMVEDISLKQKITDARLAGALKEIDDLKRK